MTIGVNQTQPVRDFIRLHPRCTVTEIAAGTGQWRALAESRVRNLWKQGEVSMKRNSKGTATFTMLKRRGPRHKVGYGTAQQRRSRRKWKGGK